MDFEIDWHTGGIAIGFWLLITALLWKFGGAWELWKRILLTVFMLPMCYFAVAFQVNR